VLPAPTGKGRPPMSEVRTVHARKLSDRVGYVRVAYFPGAAGDKFALAYERAIAELGQVEGIVIDLRGNVGGGLGSLRVMSSFCADRRPIGYNVTRKVADEGYRKDRLVQIDKIPTTKLAQLKMLIRFKVLHPRPFVRPVHRGSWTASIPWPRRSADQRAYEERGRDDRRLRRRQSTGHAGWDPYHG